MGVNHPIAGESIWMERPLKPSQILRGGGHAEHPAAWNTQKIGNKMPRGVIVHIVRSLVFS